jgi:hypothetical protein
MKTPIMDKLFYLCHRSTDDIHDKVKELNDWDVLYSKQSSSFIDLIKQVLKVANDEALEEDQDFGSGDFAFGIETLPAGDALNHNIINNQTFGAAINNIWNHR